jgi:uncharacterized membrane protein
MGKLFLAILVGLVGAGIVHIAVILSIPGQADNDAWSRLSRLGPEFATVRIGFAEPEGDRASGSPAGFVFVDPAFIDIACRFSVEDGPVRLFSDDRTRFWTASIYARNGDNLYSISERVALEGRLDLLVGTAEQLDLARIEGSSSTIPTVPVAVAGEEGYLTVRALVAAESERPFVDRFARSVTCRPATAEEAGTPAS